MKKNPENRDYEVIVKNRDDFFTNKKLLLTRFSLMHGIFLLAMGT